MNNNANLSAVFILIENVASLTVFDVEFCVFKTLFYSFFIILGILLNI